MVSPSKNVNIHEGGIGKRGGTERLGLTSGGVTRLMGIFDYRPASGTQYILTATGNGHIYVDSSTDAISGLGTDKYTSFSMMNDKAYICNGYNTPRTISATSGAVLGNLSADWTGTAYPSQMLVHGAGNSERMWAIGVNAKVGGVNLLNNLYYSKDNDGTSDAYFATGTGAGQIYFKIVYLLSVTKIPISFLIQMQRRQIGGISRRVGQGERRISGW
jgi:hypothetical protein